MSLRYAILGMLNYTPLTGYNFMTIVDKSFNHFWKASLSQIYRELSVLERKGYVISDIFLQVDRPDKKVYTITEDGKNAFRDWLGDFPEKLSVPSRDEFLIRIFFGSQLGDAELKKQFERYIEERRSIQKKLDEILNHKHFNRLVNQNSNQNKTFDLAKESRYWQFTINRAQIINDANIRWAEECIKELEDSIQQED
jgi:PadR family transcriptional regulator AphA